MSANPIENVQTLTVPVDASTTTIGPSFTFSSNSAYQQAVIIATLTGMSAGTLDVYIQECWDGRTWFDVAHFAQLGIGAAASTQRLALAQSGTSYTIGSDGVPALAAGKFTDGPWGPMLRLVSVTGAGANAAPVVQTVRFIAWRSGQ